MVLLKMVDLNGEELGLIRYCLLFLKKNSVWINFFVLQRGEKVEVMTDFLFLASKITADGDCSLKSEDDCFLAGKL